MSWDSIFGLDQSSATTAAHRNTDLSAGVEPLFAPAAPPALSPFPGLKVSQMPCPRREPVLHSLCPVWVKKHQEHLNHKPSHNKNSNMSTFYLCMKN